MTFKRYESRPVTRLAHEIGEDDVISSAVDPVSKRVIPNTYRLDVGGKRFTFKAHAAIEDGDFVIWQSEEDIYHCPRAVFLERNIVPGAPEDQEDA